MFWRTKPWFLIFVPRIWNKRGTASVCRVFRSQSDEIFWLSEKKHQIKSMMILTIAMINQDRYVNIKSRLITVITLWSLPSWESYPLWPSIRPRPGDYIIIILIIIIVFWSLPSWEGGLQYVPDQTCFFKVQLGQSAPGGRTRAIGFSQKNLSPICQNTFFLFSLFFKHSFWRKKGWNM